MEKKSSIETPLRFRSLLAYLLITFGISWGLPALLMLLAAFTPLPSVSLAPYSWLSYLVIWSPAISALICVFLLNGKKGLKKYVIRIFSWKADWKWSIFVIVFIISQNLIASLLIDLLGGGALGSIQLTFFDFFVGALLTLIEGPIEEIGWRGYALPKLQQRYSGWQSAIILAFIWATWHVPALFVESIMTGSISGSVAVVILRLYINIFITSLIMTIVYNATEGSIPLMMMYHWLMNIAYPWEAEAGINVIQDIIGIIVLIMMFIIFYKQYLQKENLVRQIFNFQ